jgi:hypothetical protein
MNYFDVGFLEFPKEIDVRVPAYGHNILDSQIAREYFICKNKADEPGVFMKRKIFQVFIIDICITG